MMNHEEIYLLLQLLEPQLHHFLDPDFEVAPHKGIRCMTATLIELDAFNFVD